MVNLIVSSMWRTIHYFLKPRIFVFKITGRLKVLNFKQFYDYYLNNQTMFVFADLQKTPDHIRLKIFLDFIPIFWKNI